MVSLLSNAKCICIKRWFSNHFQTHLITTVCAPDEVSAKVPFSESSTTLSLEYHDEVDVLKSAVVTHENHVGRATRQYGADPDGRSRTQVREDFVWKSCPKFQMQYSTEPLFWSIKTTEVGRFRESQWRRFGQLSWHDSLYLCGK